MGGGYVTNAGVFLIDVLFGLYIFAVLLRFLLQIVRAENVRAGKGQGEDEEEEDGDAPPRPTSVFAAADLVVWVADASDLWSALDASTLSLLKEELGLDPRLLLTGVSRDRLDGVLGAGSTRDSALRDRIKQLLQGNFSGVTT